MRLTGGFGIVSYGAAIPRRRLRVEEVLRVWSHTHLPEIRDGLNVKERVVLGGDEDTTTLALDAANQALERIADARDRIGALYLGTCTDPYDSRPTATILSEALGLRPSAMCADVQFAEKSGTAAWQICDAMVRGGLAARALAIASDTINRHTSPGDLQEPYASAGAAAFLVGRADVVAEVEGSSTHNTELADSFRIEGDRYIQSGSRLGMMKNDIGVFAHCQAAGSSLLEDLSAKPGDYRYAIFPQTYGAMSYQAGRQLGFQKEQIDPGVIADRLGNCGAAGTLLGLARVLDRAEPGERIFLASYGFGAGSDAISLKVTPEIKQLRRRPSLAIDELIGRGEIVDYATACRLEFKYMRPAHVSHPNL